MTEFDLSKLVREVHDDTDLTDYEQVAKEVRSRIPKADAEAAFLIALEEYVRNRFQKRHYEPTSASGAKPGNKSQKRDAIRQWWQRQLNQRYGTGEGYKLLRDFTVDDCAYQAELTRKQAESLLAKAEQWDELGTLLKLNKAAKVGDLP